VIELAKAALDIGIIVNNLAMQSKFYGETLGLPKLGEISLGSTSLHIFAFGDSYLKLYEFPGAAADLEAKPLGAERGLAYLTLTVRDLDHAVSMLLRADVELLTPPAVFESKVEGGSLAHIRARYAIFSDPEGNRIELLELL